VNILLCSQPFQIPYFNVIFYDDAISFCDYIAQVQDYGVWSIAEMKQTREDRIIPSEVCPSDSLSTPSLI